MNDSVASATQNSDNLGKPTALVVDDDPTILKILRATCEMLNFEVTTAKDGEDAWEIFNSTWPDIVISDIYMPKMNGLFLLHHIKSVKPNTPVVLITGYSHYNQLIATSEVKPNGFIEKPFEIDALCRTIIKLRESRN